MLDSATARLREAGVDSPRRTAEWLLEDVGGVTREALHADPGALIPEGVGRQLEEAITRRMRREPLQYILGHTDFYGLRLHVSPAVLIPRPETEEVVEAALQTLEGFDAPWVLDVGTGSGAIALAIKSARPDAEIFAADVSRDALAMAQANAVRLDLPLTLVEADALGAAFVRRVPPTFHLMISNPPYVPEAERADLQPEVREHEPELALFVPDEDPLMFYRALLGHAESVLLPGGWLVVETHADGGEAVRGLFMDAGMDQVELRCDLAGRPRLVRGRNSWR